MTASGKQEEGRWGEILPLKTGPFQPVQMGQNPRTILLVPPVVLPVKSFGPRFGTDAGGQNANLDGMAQTITTHRTKSSPARGSDWECPVQLASAIGGTRPTGRCSVPLAPTSRSRSFQRARTTSTNRWVRTRSTSTGRKWIRRKRPRTNRTRTKSRRSVRCGLDRVQRTRRIPRTTRWWR
jgi:hypothetical protein